MGEPVTIETPVSKAIEAAKSAESGDAAVTSKALLGEVSTALSRVSAPVLEEIEVMRRQIRRDEKGDISSTDGAVYEIYACICKDLRTHNQGSPPSYAAFLAYCKFRR